MPKPPLATIFLAVPFALSPPSAAQEPSPGAVVPAADGDAQVAFDAGSSAFDAGNFPQAAAQFEVAYRLTGSAEVAFNVGLSYDHGGEPARAAVWYRVYVEALPDADDRAEVEARIADLEGTGSTAHGGGGGDDDEGEHPLADHRLRLTAGWAFYPGGASHLDVTTTTAPADLDGFRLEVGYHYRLWRGLVLDLVAGGTFSVNVASSNKKWDVWSAVAGLGWVWTSFPYVVFGVRGGLGFYAMNPSFGDIHWLVPFRAGAWVEFPVLDWMALHLGGDLVLGAYVGRDDKVFGYGGEVGVGLCFSLGGDRSDDDQASDDDDEGDDDAPFWLPASHPGLRGPDRSLDRGWQ